jgi:tRNA 2-thiouridine synthesizing protein A
VVIWDKPAPVAESQLEPAEEPAFRSESGKTDVFTSLLGADVFYDAGSQGCGDGPLDKIAGIMRKLQPGQTLEVRATDPAVTVDLPAWCRMTGHTLVLHEQDRYLIERKP